MMRTLSKRCASSKRRYLSKRLLSDRSPRAQGALRSMLYGGGDRDASNANPNFTKVLSMGEGARPNRHSARDASFAGLDGAVLPM